MRSPGSAPGLDDHLPAGLVHCRSCRSVGYRYERYCVCCGATMVEPPLPEGGCRRCGATIEHAVAHYCGQCGSSIERYGGRTAERRELVRLAG